MWSFEEERAKCLTKTYPLLLHFFPINDGRTGEVINDGRVNGFSRSRILKNEEG